MLIFLSNLKIGVKYKIFPAPWNCCYPFFIFIVKITVTVQGSMVLGSGFWVQGSGFWVHRYNVFCPGWTVEGLLKKMNILKD